MDMSFSGRLERDYPIFLQRIFENSEMDENGCWIFKGATDKDTGYGQINLYRTKKLKVHRLVGFCTNGLKFVELTNMGIQICHSCDTRNCINPLHLWVGDKSQNFKDAIAKGRWHNQYSNNLPNKDWGVN